MRVEFFIDASRGMGCVLSPIKFHDAPATPRGRIQVGGGATLCTNGDRHILNLRCDAMPTVDAEAIQALVNESVHHGLNFNPRREGGCYVLDIPLKGLRSQWVSGRLLCYAEVGGQPSSSMEIPGVSTVLVLCDRADRFRDYFRRRQPDYMELHRAEFGETRYMFPEGENWYGLDPSTTKWATIGFFTRRWPEEGISLVDAISQRYERIFLEGDCESAESRRYTAAEVMEQRDRSRITGMRVSRMIVDDPIARHDSSEYFEEMARVRYATEIQRLATMESLGLDISIPSTPHSNNIYSAWLGSDWVRDRQITGIGDISCLNNARDRHLRCAVNPMGPCEGCSHYEKRPALHLKED